MILTFIIKNRRTLSCKEKTNIQLTFDNTPLLLLNN